jgi:hypothetical protein
MIWRLALLEPCGPFGDRVVQSGLSVGFQLSHSTRNLLPVVRNWHNHLDILIECKNGYAIGWTGHFVKKFADGVLFERKLVRDGRTNVEKEGDPQRQIRFALEKCKHVLFLVIVENAEIGRLQIAHKSAFAVGDTEDKAYFPDVLLNGDSRRGRGCGCAQNVRAFCRILRK